MRYGVPTAIASFYTSGLLLGLFSAMVLDVNRPNRDDIKARQYVQIVWGGGMAGALLGGAAAYVGEIRPGQSLFISSTTNWAGLGGFGVASTLQDDMLKPIHANTALIGSLSGLALSSTAVKFWKFNPSATRIQSINLAGSAGVLTGLFLATTSTATTQEAWATYLTIGGFTGLGLGAWLTSDMKPDTTPLHLKEKAEVPWLNRVNFALAPTPEGMLAQVNFTW